ncbi:cation diffusion facilitator family transporter [Halanaerobium saccharolyticum]|jgi:cobalt-zinc-cadmium efflux system protein|uniref:Cobalt-zinc-cadmium efflux system protein n=1 Tax=Halanaerobium saccharolyticum TaxID=43595 RepID=A0A2T5RNU8_9FIRM|nr:cation diffusion facilitator family transporter [Halanaerobium saccharolyticum]PTW01309.1 cobalt-zinc-cadmium efflux system protein [Halanaerobium saccharolyticum]
MSDHHHQHDHSAVGNIKFAFFLNLSFSIIEIIGGLLTNSMAILSDALHDLGDSISLAVSWYLENFSQQGADEDFSYGYARFSLLGALINSLVLILGSFFILSEVIPRLFNPQTVHPEGMLFLAIIGITVNGISVLKLRGGSSLNKEVVSWHLMEDLLGWTAVLIVSIILIFKSIPILDPLLSLLINIYILYNVISKLKRVLNIFLQGVPGGIDIKKLQQKLVEQTEALAVHHTHVWTLEGEKNFLSTHLIIPDQFSKEDIIKLKSQVKNLMAAEKIDHVTVEIEYKNENCEDKNCDA